MRTNEIVTAPARIRNDEGGFVRVTLLPGAVQTLVEAKEEMKALSAITEGETFVMLVDIRGVKSQTREARAHITENGAKNARAAAILVASPTSRVIGNFFMMLVRLPIPTRMFTSEADAIAWLREFPA